MPDLFRLRVPSVLECRRFLQRFAASYTSVAPNVYSGLDAEVVDDARSPVREIAV
jgi:hypothetical protein